MTMMHRIAPIFPVRNLATSLAHYERLGFTTRSYEGGGYGYATRDGVELHLGVTRDSGALPAAGSAYVGVDDADALAREWLDRGLDVHLPADTPWGQHEGSHVDPDGNILRFGSPSGARAS